MESIWERKFQNSLLFLVGKRAPVMALWFFPVLLCSSAQRFSISHAGSSPGTSSLLVVLVLLSSLWSPAFAGMDRQIPASLAQDWWKGSSQLLLISREGARALCGLLGLVFLLALFLFPSPSLSSSSSNELLHWSWQSATFSISQTFVGFFWTHADRIHICVLFNSLYFSSVVFAVLAVPQMPICLSSQGVCQDNMQYWLD